MNPVDRIVKRLPPGDEIAHMDVAMAFNVSSQTVESWRESGEFAGQCLNKGAGKLARWFYMREAVIAFAKRRVG